MGIDEHNSGPCQECSPVEPIEATPPDATSLMERLNTCVFGVYWSISKQVRSMGPIAA